MKTFNSYEHFGIPFAVLIYVQSDSHENIHSCLLSLGRPKAASTMHPLRIELTTYLQWSTTVARSPLPNTEALVRLANIHTHTHLNRI